MESTIGDTILEQDTCNVDKEMSNLHNIKKWYVTLFWAKPQEV